MTTEFDLPPIHASIFNNLQNAEQDTDDYTYLDVNKGWCIFKIKKTHIHLVNENGFQIPNLFIYDWREKNWKPRKSVWLHSISHIYTIDELRDKEWGAGVVKKTFDDDNFKLKVFLFNLFIRI